MNDELELLFPCHRYEKVYYYTLRDMICLAHGVTTIPSDYLIGNVATDELKTVAAAVFGITIPTGSNLAATQANALWCKYLAPNQLDEYIVASDKEITSPTDEVFKNWMRLFTNHLNRTFDKYTKILTTYAGQANDLLKDVEMTNIQKFNNVPQVPDITGSDFDNDDFLTTLTKNITSSEAGTIISRLEEIRRLWNDINTEWADSFGRLFMNEVI